MYKLSQYNILIDGVKDDKNKYIWNSKRGSITKFQNETYDKLVKQQFSDAEIEKLIPELRSQGLIVSKDFNEYNSIVYKSNFARFDENKDVLSLVIAPTLACNYKCVYCFEANAVKAKAMDESTIENVFKFVKRYIASHPKVKKIVIHWFGGEPILAYNNVMKPLFEGFLKICEENKLSFDSRIITNGSLLTPEIIEEMTVKFHTSFFQITFDGTCENYCQRKGTTKENYNKVKQNVYALSKNAIVNNLKTSINIRLNVDKNNYEDVKKFVQELKSDKDYNNNIRFNLGRLKCDANCAQCKEYYSVPEFDDITEEFNILLDYQERLKEPKLTWCGQYTANNFCIGPNGEIYKCEHDFGIKEKVVGDIVNGLYYNDFYMEYMNMPYNEKCKDCKFFPICLGGCPQDRYLSKTNYHCEYSEKHILNSVRQYINNKFKIK